MDKRCWRWSWQDRGEDDLRRGRRRRRNLSSVNGSVRHCDRSPTSVFTPTLSLKWICSSIGNTHLSSFGLIHKKVKWKTQQNSNSIGEECCFTSWRTRVDFKLVLCRYRSLPMSTEFVGFFSFLHHLSLRGLCNMNHLTFILKKRTLYQNVLQFSEANSKK